MFLAGVAVVLDCFFAFVNIEQYKATEADYIRVVYAVVVKLRPWLAV